MVDSRRAGRFSCPVCASPTPAPSLCAECYDAFASARTDHPTRRSPVMVGRLPSPEPDLGVVDDVEFWDAWARLGDAGHRPARAEPP